MGHKPRTGGGSDSGRGRTGHYEAGRGGTGQNKAESSAQGTNGVTPGQEPPSHPTHPILSHLPHPIPFHPSYPIPPHLTSPHPSSPHPIPSHPILTPQPPTTHPRGEKGTPHSSEPTPGTLRKARSQKRAEERRPGRYLLSGPAPAAASPLLFLRRQNGGAGPASPSRLPAPIPTPARGPAPPSGSPRHWLRPRRRALIGRPPAAAVARGAGREGRGGGFGPLRASLRWMGSCPCLLPKISDSGPNTLK